MCNSLSLVFYVNITKLVQIKKVYVGILENMAPKNDYHVL